jgi:L,D-transpeptidase ErfK/SrfK
MRGRAASAIIFLLVAAAWPAAPARAQAGLERALSRLAPVFGEPSVYDQREGKEEIFVIARRYGVSASAVHNANVGDLLTGGETLLIPTEHIAPLPRAEGIVVNLTERNLYLYQNGRPVRCFPVAIGRRGWETPTGEYTIMNKARNPTWFPPSWAVEEEPVPPGPDNPLGDRWMGLSIRGYGIHATNKPASIGRYVSHGCIRMYPEQAHELFDLVGVGTPVQIIYARIVFGFRPEEGVVHGPLPGPVSVRGGASGICEAARGGVRFGSGVGHGGGGAGARTAERGADGGDRVAHAGGG